MTSKRALKSSVLKLLLEKQSGTLEKKKQDNNLKMHATCTEPENDKWHFVPTNLGDSFMINTELIPTTIEATTSL